ncbi:hypothetical protein GP486_000114 [Trichoglossum hirsutum]|uniref:C2H2-type domain-containing protein n=1 Tax=Trichoglossum hirsutum TaxID=265104 RepID=A0A9P8LJ69_9PEZI|nr:hypothetical protein GP486_000114 [Trichoglossum hirsutum]
MDHHRGLYGYGQFDLIEEQQASSHYGTPHGSDPVEGWAYDESLRHELDLPNTNHAKPTTAFNPERNSDPSNLDAYPTASQSDCHIAFGDTGENYSSPTWPASHETLEPPDWMSTSDTTAVYDDFCQGANSGIRIAVPPNAIALELPYGTRFPQETPLPVASELARGEHARPLVHALQQDSGLLRIGGTEENPSGDIFLPKQQPPKYYCDFRPCNYQKAFGRKADRDRHVATQHTLLSPGELFQCPWPNCERKGANGFRRRDKMLDHQIRVHGDRL